MILEISSGTEKVAVEILSKGGQKKIRLGGNEILCDYIRLADGHYSLILDGIVLDVMVNMDPEAYQVSSRAGTYSFRVIDPRQAGLMERMEEASSGVQRICAEMPGKIVRVLVEKGDSVQLDQTLLVLEAMKMQNEIRAPKSGTVKEIAVEPGSAVKTGSLLLTIES